MMQKSNSPALYRQELKEKIAHVALKEFWAKGIKNVKMDDIANILSISKRTLYEIYETKEDLLFETLRMEEEQNDERMAALATRVNQNVIHVIIGYYQMKMEMLSDMNPLFLLELQRYKRVMAYLEDKQAERNEKAVEFYKLGVEQGYFRKDVEFPLIVCMCNASMNHILQDESYRCYDLKTVFRNIVMLVFRGVCTEKGVREIDKLL